jgi:hypothetical protein
MAAPRRIAIENVNKPGRTVSVDAEKYEAAKEAMLASLPAAAPGLTLAELRARFTPLLPESLFPSGAKAGWWLMAAQLDLRAKGVMIAEPTKPMRLHRR